MKYIHLKNFCVGGYEITIQTPENAIEREIVRKAGISISEEQVVLYVASADKSESMVIDIKTAVVKIDFNRHVAPLIAAMGE